MLVINRTAVGAKMAVGVVITLALVYWVNVTVGWTSVYDLVLRITAWDTVVVAAGIALSHVLRSIRLMVCYREVNDDLREIAGIGFVHNCLNFWLPMRLGELALLLLSKTSLDVSYKDSAITLVFIRLLDIHVLLLLIVFFVGGTMIHGQFLWLILACLAGLPAVLLTQRFWMYRHALLRRLQTITGSLWYWLASYALTLGTWLAKLGALSYLALRLSDIDLEEAWLAIILADATSISPITGLANAGTFEAGFVMPLALLGYPQTDTLSVAVTVHMALGMVSLLMGLLGGLLLLSRPARQAGSSPAPRARD